MLKKLTVFILVLSFLMVGIVGCGNSQDGASDTQTTAADNSNDETTNTTEAANNEPSEMTFWIYPWVDNQDAVMDSIVAEFNKQQPNIKVKYETIPWEGGPDKVNVSIASSSNPDAICDTPMRTMGYVAKGVMAPLDDVAETLKDRMDSTILDVGLYTDGKRYSIPMNVNFYLTTINMTLAKQFGSDSLVPADFESWDLEQYDKFVTASTKDGVSGIELFAGSEISDQYTIHYLLNAGAPMWDESHSKIIINSPAGVKALEYMCKWVKNGNATKGAATLKADEADALWFNGKAVHGIPMKS